jgi:hypothetical protein
MNALGLMSRRQREEFLTGSRGLWEIDLRSGVIMNMSCMLLWRFGSVCLERTESLSIPHDVRYVFSFSFDRFFSTTIDSKIKHQNGKA